RCSTSLSSGIEGQEATFSEDASAARQFDGARATVFNNQILKRGDMRKLEPSEMTAAAFQPEPQGATAQFRRRHREQVCPHLIAFCRLVHRKLKQTACRAIESFAVVFQ